MESFVFYTHYAKKMKKLPLEQAALLLYAICDYVENGTEPQLEDAAADMCFSFIRTQLDKDISRYEDTCRKRSEAGRRGAAATNSKRQQEAAKAAFAGNDDSTSTPIQSSDQSSELTEEPENAEASETHDESYEEKKAAAKAKKKKEPPKTKYGEFVTMYDYEYESLVSDYGAEKVARMIEVLDNYKGSKGKTYKSDYRAILSWVADRVQEEFSRRESYVRPNQTWGDQFTPSGDGWKKPDE